MVEPIADRRAEPPHLSKSRFLAGAPPPSPDTDREQLEALFEQLSPADRALLLEFARRLLR